MPNGHEKDIVKMVQTLDSEFHSAVQLYSAVTADTRLCTLAICGKKSAMVPAVLALKLQLWKLMKELNRLNGAIVHGSIAS